MPAYDRLIAGIQVLEIPAAGSPINVPISSGADDRHKPEIRVSVTLHFALEWE